MQSTLAKTVLCCIDGGSRISNLGNIPHSFASSDSPSRIRQVMNQTITLNRLQVRAMPTA